MRRCKNSAPVYCADGVRGVRLHSFIYSTVFKLALVLVIILILALVLALALALVLVLVL